MTQFVPDGEAAGEGSEEPLAPASADIEQEVAPDAEAQVLDAETAGQEAGAPAQEAEVVTEEETIDYEALFAERTADLQRLQAEYQNYKKRVDRDRGVARLAGEEAVLKDLLPVLDAISLARQHEELNGGGKLIIDELEKVIAKHGLQTFGEVGVPFDPTRHEALMQLPMEEPVEVITISQVMQPGYEFQGRIIRPARVAVANP